MCLYAGRLRTRKLSRRSALREVKEGVQILRDGVGVEPPFGDPGEALLLDLDFDSPWDDLADEDLLRLYSALYGETLLLVEGPKSPTVH